MPFPEKPRPTEEMRDRYNETNTNGMNKNTIDVRLLMLSVTSMMTLLQFYFHFYSKLILSSFEVLPAR